MNSRRLLALTLLVALPCAPTAGTAQDVMALQGLRANTFVAGKTTGFRIFLPQSHFDAAARIDATVLRPDGSLVTKSWSRSELVAIPDSPRGPSLWVRVPGGDMPWIGNYRFDARVFNAQGGLLTGTTSVDAELLPTKDVRLLVTFLFKGNDPGAFQPTAAWTADVQRSMQRLGSMFPVRDGVQSTLDGDLNNGLRYVIGTPCDGYIAGYYDCVYGQTRTINATSGDHVDVTVEFRPGIFTPVCREVPCGAGGNSGRPPSPYGDLRRASCVAGNMFGTEMTAPCFAQEIGHNFGLEPPTSPHYQDPKDPIHSKDPFVDDPFAYDFVRDRPFGRIGDTMNNLGGGASQGADAVMFNAFDSEYLRQQILGLPSSGPTLPPHFTSDRAIAVTGVGPSVGLFARRADGRIYYNRAALGHAGQGWAEMEGGGRTDAAPSAGAVGEHVFVAIKGLDGEIHLNQADFGHPFGQWFPMNLRTDASPAVVGVGHSVFVFAKGLDQRVYLNQAEFGHAFSGWFPVQGDARTDAAPAAGVVGSRIFVGMKGLDGRIYINQADFGHPFGQWFPMNFRTNVPPALVGVGNSIFVFAKSPDQRVHVSQAPLGQAFSEWFEVQGNGRTDLAPAAGAIGSHVFVGIKGVDGRIYLNQADFGRPFGQWFP